MRQRRLTDELKARIVADREKQNVNPAVRARIAKNRKRQEQHALNVKMKIESAQKAAQRLRSEQAHTEPQYQALAIGLMIAGERRADLRGLVAGLAGITEETESDVTPAAITAGTENHNGKEE
jgi:hypothetical protein